MQTLPTLIKKLFSFFFVKTLRNFLKPMKKTILSYGRFCSQFFKKFFYLYNRPRRLKKWCLKRCAMFWNGFLCSWVCFVRLLGFEIWLILYSTFVVNWGLAWFLSPRSWFRNVNQRYLPENQFAREIQSKTIRGVVWRVKPPTKTGV